MNWTDGALKQAFASSRSEAWTDGFAGLVEDIPRSRLIEVQGKVPATLRGTLFRNGPARHELGPARYSHRWDADGMVHAFRFTAEGVFHEGRFVRTKKFLREASAGRPLVSAFGSTLGDISALNTDVDEMNVGNTNVIVHRGELLALWEAGSAYEMCPIDLGTRCVKSWGSAELIRPFSAHPKLEQEGGLWNFGADPLTGELSVYHISRAGVVDVMNRLRIDPLPPVHDFAITKNHLVFILSPLALSKERLEGGAPFGRSFAWSPELGTRVLVVSKSDMRQRWYTVPAFAVYHIGNAWEDDGGTIRLDFMADDDPRGAMAGWTLMAGRYTHVRGASLRLLTLRPTGTADVATPFDHEEGEFPVVDPILVGRRHCDVVYVARSGDRPADLPGWDRVVRFGLETGRKDEYVLGPRWIVEEHVYAGGGSMEKAPWVVGVGLDLERRRSALLVFAARQISAGPVAVAYLERALPFGLHGTFWPGA